MSKGSLKVSAVIPARPQAIYDAWLDSTAHTNMTGGQAEVDPTVDGRHTAWDGYIEGRNRELDHGRRIVQSWRTANFPDDAEDSNLEVILEPQDEHTRVVIVHTEIPEDQVRAYEGGWHDRYFKPMVAYFTSLARDEAPETRPAGSLKATAATATATAERAKKASKKAASRKAAPKPATQKKSASNKAASKKAAPKEAAAKKAPPKKKAAAKKAPPKKAAPKKSVAKKPAKKTGPKKSAPKKAPKKAAKKKSSKR